ncbi:uncharacterized protein BDR25DRAFT_291605, partial [Lindgomyces ingoldianus]
MPLPQRQKASKGRPLDRQGSNISDSRFSSFQTDPRFRLPSKKHAKTKLDSRFSRLLTDDDFHTKASVDRYGRKITKGEGRKKLERFYRVDKESQDEEDDKGDKAIRKELAKVDRKGQNYDPIRDGGLSSSSSDESSSGEDGEEEEEVEEQAELAEQGSEVPMGEVTARLAAVNMDWDNIRATDILAVANSFVPADGRILNVVIYPSEFGLERMQREELEGPPRDIFSSTAEKNKKNLTSLDHSPSLSDSEEDDDEAIKKDLLKENSGEDFDSKALRAYQLDRLRYYYAVITCSSSTVAKSLYDNMDGREYLSSANFFDLRFVPNGVSFDEDPHDQCEKLPDSYKPNEFTTDALTHSKVKLTWDADDTTRREVQKRAFSRKEIDENDLQAYIGTDSSSSEDEAQNNRKSQKAATLRAALGLSAPNELRDSNSRSRNNKRDRNFKKPEGEMEITFSAALSANAPKGSVFVNEPPVEETTLEKYVRKQRERKAKRKERAKGLIADQEESSTEATKPATRMALNEDDEKDPFNDPFFDSDSAKNPTKSQLKKSKKEKHRIMLENAASTTSAAQRAELELLMLDDNASSSNIRHFDMNDIAKAEKAKRKGKKKRTKDEVAGAGEVQDEFQINTQDPRFAKLYESHEFAIDPTNPRFKGTQGMKALLEEGRRKRKVGRDEVGGRENVKGGKVRRKDGDERDGDADAGVDDLKKLAARVKAKSRKV